MTEPNYLSGDIKYLPIKVLTPFNIFKEIFKCDIIIVFNMLDDFQNE